MTTRGQWAYALVLVVSEDKRTMKHFLKQFATVHEATCHQITKLETSKGWMSDINALAEVPSRAIVIYTLQLPCSTIGLTCGSWCNGGVRSLLSYEKVKRTCQLHKQKEHLRQI